MRDAAFAALVSIAQIEVAQEGVVEEALKHDILIASCTCVVDAAKATSPARCDGCVGLDEARILFGRIGKKFVVLSFSIR